MSDKKITELADGGAVQATDEFVVARAGGNVKIAGSQIGSGGSSSPVVYARLSIQGGFDSGADVLVPLSQIAGFARTDGMAFTGPSTFTAGHITSPWVQLGQDLAAGEGVELNYAEFMVSNAAGTEKLRIELDIPAACLREVDGAIRNSMPFDSCSIAEQIGSDLTLVSFDASPRIPATGVAGIQSTAGGQFFQEFLVTLIYTPPT